jgi:hypothetical protein
MKAIGTIIDNAALAESYVLAYPYLPNLANAVELILQGVV